MNLYYFVEEYAGTAKFGLKIVSRGGRGGGQGRKRVGSRKHARQVVICNVVRSRAT